MTKLHPTILRLSTALVLMTIHLTNTMAADEKLECRLLIHITGASNSYSGEKDYRLKLSKRNGVANCSDNRLVQVQIMLSELEIDQSTLLSGYSVYTFENSDTLTFQLRGNESAGQTIFNYLIVEGTGEYEGAKGEGEARSVESSLKSTLQYDLSVNVKK